MGTRTNDLTEFAKPVADELAARCGSLKRVLSAVRYCFIYCGVSLLRNMERSDIRRSLGEGGLPHPGLRQPQQISLK